MEHGYPGYFLSFEPEIFYVSSWVLLEGSVFQIFNLGPSFYILCNKTGNFLLFFFNVNFDI